MNTENLVDRFKKAGLQLEISTGPLAVGRGVHGRTASGMQDIIMLDIRRKTPADSSMYFLLWPGHEDNLVQVLDADPKLQQVVLLLREPQREFNEDIVLNRHQQKEFQKDPKKWLERWYPEEVKSRNIFKHRDGTYYAKRTTIAGNRHYLAGKDERELFMCQLPKAVTTVKQAHKALVNPTVHLAEGKTGGKTIRQGEWFFINITDSEQEAINKQLKSKLVVVHKDVGIGVFAGRAGGKPHIVSELVTGIFVEGTRLHTVDEGIVRVHLRGKNTAEEGLSEMLDHNKLRKADIVEWDPKKFKLVVRMREQAGRNAVYIRGSVKHPDHATVKFNSWRRVLANTEPGVSTAVGIGRGGWVD